MAARWDKGTADYINCPMNKEEYDRFYDALVTAEGVEAKEWEQLQYFEGCLPIEETGAARAGHTALRADEAGGPARSADGQDAACGGAVALRESARGLLQPGGLSESPEVWRAGAGAAADSGPGECAIPALRADSPQHLYQSPWLLDATLAMREHPTVFCRGADFGGGGLHGIHRRRGCWRGCMRRRWRRG